MQWNYITNIQGRFYDFNYFTFYWYFNNIFGILFNWNILYIKKTEFIINRELNKTQKVYNITNVHDYFKSLGKLNLYMSFLFYIPFIIVFYRDITDNDKYSFLGDILVPMAYFYILYNVFQKRF